MSTFSSHYITLSNILFIEFMALSMLGSLDKIENKAPKTGIWQKDKLFWIHYSWLHSCFRNLI